jgi:hypothetical protein
MTIELRTTRDMEICEYKGMYFFTITESGKIIYTSGRYFSVEECTSEGFHMMDALHERAPLQCNTVWE